MQKYITKDIIIKKRNNQELSENEIQFFIDGIVDNTISNEQISSMAMAIFFNGLNNNERKLLTISMRNSGNVIKFENLIDKPIIDKHSTGGVGDLVSIPLAPIVAACGAYVPMITGKGLGHTGGTTDKMLSIPGYDPFPDVEKFKSVTKNVGCAIIGQTANLAPADRRIYSVRDVTGTVESIDLIASSILSKKLASGINYLIMDVKVGNGAFMETIDSATQLAEAIVNISEDTGVPTVAFLTDMNECLADNIGNSLEIINSIEYLLGKNSNKKLDIVLKDLACEMLIISKLAINKDDAINKINNAITSGKAAEIFEKMVYSLGGCSNILSSYNKILPKAPISKPIFLKKEGYLASINNRELGMCLVLLGGGRKTTTDVLDLSVGLENVAKIGTFLNKDTPFAVVHAQKESDIMLIENKLNEICTLVENENELTINPAIYKKVTK